MPSESMISFRTLLLYLSFVFLLFFTLSESKEILVGGKENSWKIPSSPSDILNNWAQKTRFKIGDSLVWKYNGAIDSVLQVSKEEYESCKVTNPIKEYKDGNTKIVLDKSGPFYFISGAEGHCEKGQKLIVIVLSDKHSKSSDVESPVPTPFPARLFSPAEAPAAASDGRGLRGGLMGVMLGLGSLVGVVNLL